MIIFTTYTVLDGICVLNHRSVHKLNGNLLYGTQNLFDFMSDFECYDGTDGEICHNLTVKL